PTLRVEGPAAGTDVRIKYHPFAAILSDDGSQVDAGHAYLNGTSVFLAARGRERELHQVRADVPRGWRGGTAPAPSVRGWQAPGYEALIDAPIEMGRFASGDVRAAG